MRRSVHRRRPRGPALIARRLQRGRRRSASTRSISRASRRSTSARLRAALATRQSDKLPWGKKAFFDRSRFDADLKRIQAFYADRGYPGRARHRLRRQAERQAGCGRHHGHDCRRRTGEGRGDRLRRIRRCDSADAPRRRCKNAGAAEGRRAARSPARRDDPRDGAQRAEGSRLSVREGRRPSEDDGPDGKTRDADLHRRARARSPTSDRSRSQGNKTVSARVIARQLTFKTGRPLSTQRAAGFPAAAVRPGAVPVRQHRDRSIRSCSRPRCRFAITVAEGKHQRVNFGVGYGTEEKARVDARVPPRELPRRRAAGRRARALVVARPRHPAQFQPAVLLRARISRSAARGSSGTRSRPRTNRSSPARR